MGLQKKLKEAEQTMTNIKRTGVDRQPGKKNKKILAALLFNGIPVAAHICAKNHSAFWSIDFV